MKTMRPEDLTAGVVRDYVRVVGGFNALTYEQDLDCQCLLGITTTSVKVEASRRIADAINALRNHGCCAHPVERHAYNGCSDCGCSVRWIEHPGRLFDMSSDEHTRDAIAAARAQVGRPT